VELTESLVIQDPARSLDTMMRLRMKGIGLWLDDFGTGYSSMEQLRRLPVSAVKIDRSFIPGEGNWEGNLALLEGLVELGSRLGLAVIAEGVETESQLEVLRQLKCGFVQGFYLGRPMPAMAFSDCIDRRKV